MGISTDGGMILGAPMALVTADYGDDLWDWLDEHGMSHLSPYYDSEYDVVIGFTIEDVPMHKMDSVWLRTIKELGEKFESITGTEASLIGMQDIN